MLLQLISKVKRRQYPLCLVDALPTHGRRCVAHDLQAVVCATSASRYLFGSFMAAWQRAGAGRDDRPGGAPVLIAG